ncbi:unnamed protein product [Echinostoma caproni]|uniref:Uncharacterized protein n=1 Tax=Echinostoma caproni TaxID=27848 RepID=A0A3P8GPT4_9TREM|nr:unnamed protein product [Echinostoma caproni]
MVLVHPCNLNPYEFTIFILALSIPILLLLYPNRHTTTKTGTRDCMDFTDLTSLTTFGFRGEALASLSHVSLLTVTTRTAEQNCAYRLTYRNGNPVGNAAPCAGNTGTTILAEDLFYNTPIRRAALRSPREEFARVAEVVAHGNVHKKTNNRNKGHSRLQFFGRGVMIDFSTTDLGDARNQGGRTNRGQSGIVVTPSNTIRTR